MVYLYNILYKKKVNFIYPTLGVYLISAFLARLPVNLFDKAIAVFAGFRIYLLSKLCVKASSSIAKNS